MSLGCAGCDACCELVHMDAGVDLAGLLDRTGAVRLLLRARRSRLVEALEAAAARHGPELVRATYVLFVGVVVPWLEPRWPEQEELGL